MADTPIRIECDDITQLQPGDILLLQYKERLLTGEEAQWIKDKALTAFGESIKVLVVDAGFKPYILRNEDPQWSANRVVAEGGLPS